MFDVQKQKCLELNCGTASVHITKSKLRTSEVCITRDGDKTWRNIFRNTVLSIEFNESLLVTAIIVA